MVYPPRELIEIHALPFQFRQQRNEIIDNNYVSFADDAKILSEVCGVTLTRTRAKDITAQQAAFPAAELDTWLPKLVRAGKRVAICEEPSKVESAPKKKATRKSAKKESK